MTHATVSPVSSLASRLRDNSTVVLDASYYLAAAKRDARAEYLAGHIPGAVFFDIDALSDTATSLPHMLLPPDRFAAAMGMRMGSGSALVDRLERAGMVIRREGQEDRRQTLVELSPAGRELLERRQQAVRGRLRHAVERMSPRGRRALAIALEDMVRVLAAPAEGNDA